MSRKEELKKEIKIYEKNIKECNDELLAIQKEELKNTASIIKKFKLWIDSPIKKHSQWILKRNSPLMNFIDEGDYSRHERINIVNELLDCIIVDMLDLNSSNLKTEEGSKLIQETLDKHPESKKINDILEDTIKQNYHSFTYDW